MKMALLSCSQPLCLVSAHQHIIVSTQVFLNTHPAYHWWKKNIDTPQNHIIGGASVARLDRSRSNKQQCFIAPQSHSIYTFQGKLT